MARTRLADGRTDVRHARLYSDIHFADCDVLGIDPLAVETRPAVRVADDPDLVRLLLRIGYDKNR